MITERTLAIIKPDGVEKGIIGNIISKIENIGLKIVAMKMTRMNKFQAENFYEIHRDSPFFGSLTDFMSSGPIVLIVLEGIDAVGKYRRLMGATNYKEAALGTIRRDFATDVERNVVHGSDAVDTALLEISHFFSNFDLLNAK